MKKFDIRLHHFEPASRANGPGMRAVVWVQGCKFNCPGCFNPETHNPQHGQIWPVEWLADRILEMQTSLEGITISGGEPLYQHRALATLLETIRAKSSLSVLVFTGYGWEELQRLKDIQNFLSHVDVVIAGRYDAARRQAHSLIGSSNKTVQFLTNRYTMKDLETVPQAEVILSPEGEIKCSGIDPLIW